MENTSGQVSVMIKEASQVNLNLLQFLLEHRFDKRQKTMQNDGLTLSVVNRLGKKMIMTE